MIRDEARGVVCEAWQAAAEKLTTAITLANGAHRDEQELRNALLAVAGLCEVTRAAAQAWAKQVSAPRSPAALREASR